MSNPDDKSSALSHEYNEKEFIHNCCDNFSCSRPTCPSGWLSLCRSCRRNFSWCLSCSTAYWHDCSRRSINLMCSLPIHTSYMPYAKRRFYCCAHKNGKICRERGADTITGSQGNYEATCGG